MEILDIEPNGAGGGHPVVIKVLRRNVRNPHVLDTTDRQATQRVIVRVGARYIPIEREIMDVLPRRIPIDAIEFEVAVGVIVMLVGPLRERHRVVGRVYRVNDRELAFILVIRVFEVAFSVALRDVKIEIARVLDLHVIARGEDRGVGDREDRIALVDRRTRGIRPRPAANIDDITGTTRDVNRRATVATGERDVIRGRDIE